MSSHWRETTASVVPLLSPLKYNVVLDEITMRFIYNPVINGPQLDDNDVYSHNGVQLVSLSETKSFRGLESWRGRTQHSIRNVINDKDQAADRPPTIERGGRTMTSNVLLGRALRSVSFCCGIPCVWNVTLKH